ncbi:MAG: amidohydrolase family protein [Pseudomonadota bacterium]
MSLPSRIIDAHHHLWDLSACTYPWLMARGVHRFFGDPEPIQKNYLVSDFRADFGGLPVTQSVHIQVGVAPGEAVSETAWLQAQADATGLPSAIVAFADLTAADLEATLDAHSAHDRLRGIRQIVGRSAEEDRRTGTGQLIAAPAFLSGLRVLAARQLSFDLQLTPPQMQAAAECLLRVPDLNVALCHGGSPGDRSSEAMAQWRAGMTALAQHPGMICKLSGFGMFDHEWTPASIRPIVLEAIDIFGPDRVAFGSNFPVDKLYRPYGDVLGAYGEITSQFSDDERAMMFAGVCEQFYGIALPA